MCKIYPPLPFNKFVVFILYCLLSITLAQIYNCEVATPKRNNYTVVGYVQYNTNPSSISWNLYDYINVIVNEQFPPKDPKTKEPVKEPFKKFFDSRDALKAKSKIFLAMRPKDPLTLKQLTDDTRSDDDITNIVNLVNGNRLDGIDIEYPGKRGALCNRDNCNEEVCTIWAKGDEPKFVIFLTSLQAKLGKPIMLTVGEHEAVTNLHNVIDFINIEAYHHSIYDNMKNPPPVLPAVPPQGPQGGAQPDPLIRLRTTSNGPLNKFREIYDLYLNLYKTSKVKIIMGIDFGNTLQIVNNQDIEDNLSVEFSYDPNDTNEKTIIDQIHDKEIVKIEPFCKVPVNTPPSLYLWPWKSLSVSSNYCDSRPGWKHKFDTDNTFTPWLTKKVDGDDNKYYFVSYEDITSISHKLKFIDEVGAEGISISDISYDDKNTLLNFIRNNSQSDSLPNSATPPGKPESSTSSTIHSQGTNSNSNKGPGSNKVGAIVGSIFGVLAVVALAAVSFILWRRKNQLPIFTNKELPGIHTTPKEYNEMTTEPSRFNTVLPVSSTGYVTAMFDFEGKEASDLSFRKGDKIEVLERGDGPNDWWVGRVNGVIGEFPGNYVKETGL